MLYYKNISYLSVYMGITMAQTKTQTLSLGEYWNLFIENQLVSKRYASASELVRESLRLLEEHENAKLMALRQALVAGEESGNVGVFDPEKIRRAAKKEAGLI